MTSVTDFLDSLTYEVSTDIIARARSVLASLQEAIPTISPPSAACGPDDGLPTNSLEFYWDAGPLHMSIDIIPAMPLEFFWCNHDTKETWWQEAESLTPEFLSRLTAVTA